MERSTQGAAHSFVWPLLLFLLFIGSCLPTPLLARETALRVAFDEWPPWKMTTGQTMAGIDAAILERIGAQTSLQFEFVVAPWKRCIELLKDGEVDLITSFADNEERRAFADYVQPHYYLDAVRFYGLKGAGLVLERYEDLYGYRIGVVRGAHYDHRFDQDGKLEKEVVAHERQLKEMLFAGRIDLIIDWEVPFDYQAREMGSSALLKKYGFDLTAGDDDSGGRPLQHAYFMAFSKKSKKIHHKKEFASALHSMVSRGEIERIVQEVVAQQP
nr:transporter substrate-binding domain-containing protein [Desulfogranum mediterraneum]